MKLYLVNSSKFLVKHLSLTDFQISRGTERGNDAQFRSECACVGKS